MGTDKRGFHVAYSSRFAACQTASISANVRSDTARPVSAAMLFNMPEAGGEAAGHPAQGVFRVYL